MNKVPKCYINETILNCLYHLDNKVVKTVTGWDSSYLSKKLHGKQEFTLKDLQKFVDAGFIKIQIKPSKKKIK